MPKIVDVSEDFAGFLRMGSGVPRSEGLHFSQIRDDLGKTLRIPGYEYDSGESGKGGITEDALLLMGEMGFLWEDVLSHCLGTRVGTRPQEVMLDGVAMSPDGFDFKNWELHEYKATWRSSRHQPEDSMSSWYWKWFTQIKAYCHAMGAKVCYLWVLHINGDYGVTRRGPVVKVWRLEFGEEELKKNWDMLIRHAKGRGWLS